MLASRRRAQRAWVLVADGGRAIVARNDGTGRMPRLVVQATLGATDNPATRHHGADRPGRFRKDADRRSAAEPTDWHELAETTFLRDVAAHLALLLDEEPAATAVVVAPPAALATLRGALTAYRSRITAEIAKDLTNHPLPEIARAIQSA